MVAENFTTYPVTSERANLEMTLASEVRELQWQPKSQESIAPPGTNDDPDQHIDAETYDLFPELRDENAFDLSALSQPESPPEASPEVIFVPKIAGLGLEQGEGNEEATAPEMVLEVYVSSGLELHSSRLNEYLGEEDEEDRQELAALLGEEEMILGSYQEAVVAQDQTRTWAQQELATFFESPQAEPKTLGGDLQGPAEAGPVQTNEPGEGQPQPEGDAEAEEVRLEETAQAIDELLPGLDRETREGVLRQAEIGRQEQVAGTEAFLAGPELLTHRHKMESEFVASADPEIQIIAQTKELARLINLYLQEDEPAVTDNVQDSIRFNYGGDLSGKAAVQRVIEDQSELLKVTKLLQKHRYDLKEFRSEVEDVFESYDELQIDMGEDQPVMEWGLPEQGEKGSKIEIEREVAEDGSRSLKIAIHSIRNQETYARFADSSIQRTETASEEVREQVARRLRLTEAR